jgi:hypothetical protein
MRRLLQRIEDGLYYQGRGTWTNNPDLAYSFNKTSGAIECYIRENLPPVQVVLKFEDSAFDIRLPCGVPTQYPVETGQEQEPEGGSAKGRGRQ